MVCLVLMFAPMVGAAASNNNSFVLGDFIKPEEAKKELDNSAFKNPVEKGSNWGTLALVGVIILYFGGCLYYYYRGDDDQRAKAFTGLFMGVVVVVLFMACTSTALDALTWEY